MQRISSRKLGLVTALGAVVVLIGGLIAVSGASAQGPAVSVGSLTAGVGQHAGVSLQAHIIPAPGLGAWTIDIAYNPEIVTVVECSPKQGGICNAAYSANTIRVVGTSVLGLPGESKLAAITFACKSAGSSALSVSWTVLADATIGGPRPIAAVAENGKATCTQEPKATPTEPKATPAGPFRLAFVAAPPSPPYPQIPLPATVVMVPPLTSRIRQLSPSAM